ncbi:MAG: SHOCT domain-containing protein [Alphaproteobacteria bacterium]|nr:SHOCT domain-containing protein [Alphaproteobacteria bacterium]
MKGIDTKHVTAFRAAKLKSGEQILAHLEGWVGDVMGKGDKTQRNGQFILTNERACFYRKGLMGEVFETIPLPKITSVETLSRMGWRVLRLHTSHDELAFKTFEAKESFEQVYELLEQHRHQTPASPGTSQSDPMEQLKKLGELRDSGLLTEDEFAAKKVTLLARL